MRFHRPVDRRRRCTQRLGDDVTSVQPTPRVLTTGTHVGVGTVGFEIEKLGDGHGVRLGARLTAEISWRGR